jgi:hypothetical protein
MPHRPIAAVWEPYFYCHLLLHLLTLDSAVAGLKTAHLRNITSDFELSVLTLTVPGFKPPKSSKPFVLLSTCTICILLNCRIEDNSHALRIGTILRRPPFRA